MRGWGDGENKCHCGGLVSQPFPIIGVLLYLGSSRIVPNINVLSPAPLIPLAPNRENRYRSW